VVLKHNAQDSSWLHQNNHKTSLVVFNKFTIISGHQQKPIFNKVIVKGLAAFTIIETNWNFTIFQNFYLFFIPKFNIALLPTFLCSEVHTPQRSNCSFTAEQLCAKDLLMVNTQRLLFSEEGQTRARSAYCTGWLF